MKSESRASTREFDHVVLTRFSVRFEGWPPPTDDWLEYRWVFFRDALASSAARQTVRDFHWLVFFDIDTPDWLRDEIDSLSEGLFSPRYVSEWSVEVARRSVAEITDAPYLITTRVDSDDALATRFIADIQSHFDRQTSLYVNLMCGVQIARSGELYRYDEPSNPFISYIEKRNEFLPPRTVFFDLAHGHSRRHGDILNVVGPPRWMQIVHGTNLANGVRGLRARPEPFEADFDLELAFDRSVSTRRYRRERARSAFDLVVFWALHPRYALERAETRRLRRAGTVVLPRRASRSGPAAPPWLVALVRPLGSALRRADNVRRQRRGR